MAAKPIDDSLARNKKFGWTELGFLEKWKYCRSNAQPKTGESWGLSKSYFSFLRMPFLSQSTQCGVASNPAGVGCIYGLEMVVVDLVVLDVVVVGAFHRIIIIDG